MLRHLAVCTIGLLYATQTPQVMAQAHDPRIDKLIADTEELKRTVADQQKKLADQEKRIAELEKTVKSLQTAAAPPVPAPIPSPTPAWSSASSWNQIKPGMSEAQVMAILGSPTSVQSVEDSRTLFYQPGSSSTSNLSGSVSLKDDRVTAMTPPAF